MKFLDIYDVENKEIVWEITDVCGVAMNTKEIDFISVEMDCNIYY